MKNILCLIAMASILILCIGYHPAHAADYPAKPITIINPVAPGGSRDVLARAFASVAEKYLGQPVMVVNKAGASGMIGGLAGAQAAPDGYTLTVTSTGDNCALEWEIANGRKPPFTRHDFVPIGSFILSPCLIVVPYNSSWKTLTDLVKDCAAKPGHYAFATGGMYGIAHISAEILMNAVGIKARHVPYKGGGPSLTAVVGGHVDFSVQFPPPTIPLARGNKLRILAVMGDERFKALPDIPTAKELGIHAKNIQYMIGLLVPKKTPIPVVQKLREVMAKVVEDKVFTDALAGVGEEVNFMNGDELSKYLDEEARTISKIMLELPKEGSKK